MISPNFKYNAKQNNTSENYFIKGHKNPKVLLTGEQINIVI